MQMAYCQNMINLSAINAIHNIIIKRSQMVLKIFTILIPKEFQPTTTKYLPRPEQFKCFVYIKQYKWAMIYRQI